MMTREQDNRVTAALIYGGPQIGIDILFDHSIQGARNIRADACRELGCHMCPVKDSPDSFPKSTSARFGNYPSRREDEDGRAFAVGTCDIGEHDPEKVPCLSD